MERWRLDGTNVRIDQFRAIAANSAGSPTRRRRNKVRFAAVRSDASTPVSAWP